MRLKLKVDLQDGVQPVELTTNMFVICEWEKTEGRKISDGKGIGYTDLVCWAYNLLKLSGQKMPATYRDWVKENPNMTIEAIDETDPNLTAQAVTEGNQLNCQLQQGTGLRQSSLTRAT